MNKFSIFTAFLLMVLPSVGYATWSVVAVDPNTGEVGAAGATCHPDVAVIASIVPGKGAVVAQGLTSFEGRDHAKKMLSEGNSANAVIEAISSKSTDRSFFVIRHVRQYGVASLTDGVSSVASFTGKLTARARGKREAAGVSVQGNMLASPAVLDKTLEHFSKTPKSCGMAIALLNALEAGASAGGDKRCSFEQSALSAFVFVSKPGDAEGSLSVRLVSPNQQKGERNPVKMLREQLRSSIAENTSLPSDCAL